MSILIYIMIIWFAWYPMLVWRKWGVLSSISASSYKWIGNQKAWFMGWLIGLGAISYFLPLGDYVLGMILGFAIAGMSPDHKSDPDSVEDGFHTVGTIVAIASAFAGLILIHGLWWPAICFVLGAGLLWWKANNWIWWAECLAAACITAGLLKITV